MNVINITMEIELYKIFILYVKSFSSVLRNFNVLYWNSLLDILHVPQEGCKLTTQLNTIFNLKCKLIELSILIPLFHQLTILHNYHINIISSRDFSNSLEDLFPSASVLDSNLL